MRIPTLEEELEQITSDAAAVIDWAEHVRLQVRKAIDRLRGVSERENAAFLCEELAAEHFAQQGGGPLAAVAIEAATRIRAGQRARTFQTTGGEIGR